MINKRFIGISSTCADENAIGFAVFIAYQACVPGPCYIQTTLVKKHNQSSSILVQAFDIDQPPKNVLRITVVNLSWIHHSCALQMGLQ